MKIPVTSASGKLGASIVNQLVKDLSTEQVIAIARNTEKARSLGVEVRQGHYNEKSHFDAALKDIDAVLLVSGMDAPDKRVGQRRNVINASKDAGLKKIVYTSIIGESRGIAPLRGEIFQGVSFQSGLDCDQLRVDENRKDYYY
jgi:NAD(P)H dehydrogenase (quinone)